MAIVLGTSPWRGLLVSLFYAVNGSALDIYLAVLFTLVEAWPTVARTMGPLGRRTLSMLGAGGILTSLVGLELGLRLLLSRTTDVSQDGSALRPLLFPSRTTHARLFPEKHSFSYSYLSVGIPVGWKGRSGGLIESGLARPSSRMLSSLLRALDPRSAWFRVDPQNYLSRSSGPTDLRDRLDEYLKSQVSQVRQKLCLWNGKVTNKRAAKIGRAHV